MARRRKPKGKKTGSGKAGKPAVQPTPALPAYERAWFPWVLLVALTLIAYANAWPDVLVFDDREFLAGDRFDALTSGDFIRFFSQSLWEAGANAAALYRPLLLVSLGFENLVFGDWYAGYHLANILRHALAVLLVFGFLRAVLRATGLANPQWFALGAAAVFAVHPVLSDAVASVFNGSDIYVTIFVVGGLWYLLVNRRERPVRAWGVAGLCYFLALLYKESAVAMPALAVVVLWLTSSDVWPNRVRLVAPAVLLVLPLAAYLGMRAEALEEFDSLAAQLSLVPTAYAAEPESAQQAAKPGPTPAPPLRRFGLSFEPARAGTAVSMWFDGLRLMAFPYPLATLRVTSTTPLWLAAGAQLVLLGLCVFAWVHKRPEPLLGLLFFYLAILPASRIVGEGAVLPQLMDRMLYLPSVGLVIAFAALLSLLANRFRPRVALIATVVVTLVFVPVTWARNHQWGDEIRLLEHDFAVMQQSGQLMFALVRAHANRDDELRALDLCEQHADLANRLPPVANECAQAAQQLRRFDQAEAYFLESLARKSSDARTHFLLARLYIDMDRWSDAQTHYRQAIDRERIPYLREFFSGMMLVDLYPYHPDRLDEARLHLENTLRLQPRFIQARAVLEQLESRPRAKSQ